MTLDFRSMREQLRGRGNISILENNAVIISENTPGTGLVRGAITVNAGSLHDGQFPGMMHFLEHMVFNGSMKYPNPIAGKRRAGLFGLDVNAATSSHSTTYPLNSGNGIPLLEQNFLSAWDYLFDSVYHPLLTEEMVVKERLIIINERMAKASQAMHPYVQRMDEISKRLYQKNGWQSINGLGTEDSLAKITAEAMQAHHRYYYVGSNSFVALEGDLNNHSLLGRITEQVSAIPNGTPSQRMQYVSEEPFRGEEQLVFSSDPRIEGKVCMVSFYFQIPREGREDIFALQCLNAILGGGAQSLLFEDMREKKQLVYDIGSTIEGHERTNYLKISYATSSENLPASMQRLNECLTGVKTGTFDDDLVNVYLARSLPETLLRYQGKGWIFCELKGKYMSERYGYPFYSFEEMIQGNMDVTKRSVVAVANQYLTDNRLLVVVEPKY